jgi:hypothetical protein
MPAIWNSYSKGQHLDVGMRRRERACDVQALADREHRALVVADRDRNDQALEEPAGTGDQILMAEGHRIEGPGIDGGQAGDGGHGVGGS